MTPLDGYWGAKRVMAFRNEQIRAILDEGRFQDPKVVDYMTKVLESRRDAIGRAWFKQVLPLKDFALSMISWHSMIWPSSTAFRRQAPIG
jgi:hypothetical protein